MGSNSSTSYLDLTYLSQVDSASLVAEICGAKRSAAELHQGEADPKKMKGEEKLIMTGLSEVEIKERMGEVVKEPKDEELGEVDEEAVEECRREAEEEEGGVTSLVEAAPRIKVGEVQGV